MDTETLKIIITQAVENSVEKTVNGKIKTLDKKFDDYNVESERFRRKVIEHVEKSERHMEDDSKWKETMKPIFDKVPELATVGQTVETAQNIKKTAVWWAGFFAAVSTIVGGGAWLFKTLFTAIVLNIK